MNAILPDKLAKTLCIEWMKELDSSELGQKLKEKSCGRMLGILVCTDNTVLRAFSGEMLGYFTYNGFVPPVFNPEKMQKILDESDNAIRQEKDKDKRSELSRNYWHRIQNLYEFNCFDKTVRTLSQIAPSAPAGTGDCCAPRLLSQCYKDGKEPLSMAEFYYGDGPGVHKQFYTPCDERCKPILKHIIGLDVVYLDEDIVVINKPSGLLAIEGKTENDCIASRVRKLYRTIQQPCIHRLDQATSGLMVLALTQKAHDILSKDFEERRITKEYTAVVEGRIQQEEGKIELPLRLDTNNRPHQIVDFENGKSASTIWTRLKVSKYNGNFRTILLLTPQTGRTHQLRVHCAEGLKHPIVNDSLYGSNPDNEELMLCATKLGFTHPITKKTLVFEIEPTF